MNVIINELGLNKLKSLASLLDNRQMKQLSNLGIVNCNVKALV